MSPDKRQVGSGVPLPLLANRIWLVESIACPYNRNVPITKSKIIVFDAQFMWQAVRDGLHSRFACCGVAPGLYGTLPQAPTATRLLPLSHFGAYPTKGTETVLLEKYLQKKEYYTKGCRFDAPFVLRYLLCCIASRSLLCR